MLLTTPTHPSDRLLRREEVLAITGLSRVTQWRRQKENKFPAPMQVGPRSVRWRLSDIETWLAGLQKVAA